MISTCPRIVITGANSGVGKTAVSLALVSALTRRGLRVQGFKVGPDFLDPTYLSVASGRPCYNPDGWMTNKEYVQGLVVRATQDADIAVVEGVMGLFDGADFAHNEGSTAEIALWLDAPVLVVVNVHGVARSIAPIVKGFAECEPDLDLAGVVANHCGSEKHGTWLVEALKSSDLPELVAAIPRDALPELPSRHLGLVTADDRSLSPDILEALADAFENHAEVERIVEKARDVEQLHTRTVSSLRLTERAGSNWALPTTQRFTSTTRTTWMPWKRPDVTSCRCHRWTMTLFRQESAHSIWEASMRKSLRNGWRKTGP